MKKIVILSVLSFLSLNAAGFQNIGYKSISMGGASVSNATGDMAIYSNPALLGDTSGKFNASLGHGITIIDPDGAAQAIYDLNTLDFYNLFSEITENNVDDHDNFDSEYNEGEQFLPYWEAQNLQKARDIMAKRGNSTFYTKIHSHIFFNKDNFGLGILNTTEAKSTLSIDTSKTKLIVWTDTNNNGFTDESDAYTNLDTAKYVPIPGFGYGHMETSSVGNSNLYAYNNESLFKNILDNDNNITIEAVNLTEIPVGYGHMFNPGYHSQIMVGAAAKLLIANTYFQTVAIGRYNIMDTFPKDYTTTITYGVDVGLAYRTDFLPNTTFGIVAKNLNTPTFTVLGSSNYTLKPMAKAGVSYKGSWFELAFDSDLTKNETFNGLEQMVGGGLSISPWNGTSFRGGVKSNLANENNDLIYTAGLGLGFKWISLDIAGQYGGQYVPSDIDEFVWKEQFGFALNLISRF